MQKMENDFCQLSEEIEKVNSRDFKNSAVVSLITWLGLLDEIKKGANSIREFVSGFLVVEILWRNTTEGIGKAIELRSIPFYNIPANLSCFGSK